MVAVSVDSYRIYQQLLLVRRRLVELSSGELMVTTTELELIIELVDSMLNTKELEFAYGTPRTRSDE